MSFYVYILQCSDGSYYTGHTDNLEQRIAAHQRGEISGYTAVRRPVKLVFVQDFPSREEAFQVERQVKGWARQKKEALIQHNWDRLRQLAKANG
ncbi:MAG: GIY-YIG nuclease family protein [Dehalococcoidia bacterium]|nr:GIY-YIG nuclease family protein [Dehalococcoidia bacterium]